MITPVEKRCRLGDMVVDNSRKWDLSPNDKDAIRYALAMLYAMADELARRRGSTVPAVLDQFSELVEKGNDE